MTDLFIAFIAMIILAMGESAVLTADHLTGTGSQITGSPLDGGSLPSLLAALGVPTVTLLVALALGALARRATLAGAALPMRLRPMQIPLVVLRVVPLLAFAVLMGCSDWVLVARLWVPPDVPFLCRLITVLPLPVAAVLGCVGLSLSSPRPWSQRARQLRLMLGELRPLAMALGAFLLIASLEDLRWHFPVETTWLATEPGVLVAVLCLCIVVALVFAPYGLRLAWRTSPLGPGELRARFTALAERARVTVRDIRVWHTGSKGWLNAMIAGVLGRYRCIFMTDALLATLTTADLEQVFAHELGHARLRHFLIYLLVAVTFLLFLTGVDRYLPAAAEWQWAVLLAAAFLYLRVYFGALSRHLESAADLFAARLTGSTSGTVSCLLRICDLAGARPERRSWRHPSVQQRVTILLRAEESPQFRAAFDARTRRLLWVLALLFIASAALLANDLIATSRAPTHQRDLVRAHIYQQDYRQRVLRPGRRQHRESQLLILTHDHLLEADRTLPADPEYISLHVALLRWLGDVQDLLGDPARGDDSRARAAALETDSDSDQERAG